ncbi:TCP-1/cpn60 chaperonin family-domain-containing protein [Baffinella frigidus]|nr:TCP-1/cpn60 chaperonin family-domain-containing protein [Cryptophyta sp. CCMP2293]
MLWIQVKSGPGTRYVKVEKIPYAKVEKIPGGEVEQCRVLKGVMVNKDITHPKMRRKIKNPRVILLDCTLEYKKGESQTIVEYTKGESQTHVAISKDYKKGESQTNVEISNEGDWEALLKAEEDWIKATVDAILEHKPDVVLTEKGISDLAQHYFVKGISDLAQHYVAKAGVTALRRLRKTDNNRIARVTGATICHRPMELTEAHVGTECGTFQVEKIGDEYFSFFVDCKSPKACTILLRGPSKDLLNEDVLS